MKPLEETTKTKQVTTAEAATESDELALESLTLVQEMRELTLAEPRNSQQFQLAASKAASQLEDALMDTLDSEDPILETAREKELQTIQDRINNSGVEMWKDWGAKGFAFRKSKGIYLNVPTSELRKGQHQVVIPFNGLMLKSLIESQDIEAQSNDSQTYIRVGGERFSWNNVTAMRALEEIGVDVPIANTMFFHVGWTAAGKEHFPAVLPIVNEGADETHTFSSTFNYTGQSMRFPPNLAFAEDLSEGGQYEVRDYFDTRNEALDNIRLIDDKVTDSAKKILQYCYEHCKETGMEKQEGYESSFSFHAKPKNIVRNGSSSEFSKYESEARSIFFVLVDKDQPNIGRLIVGDLDGIELYKK